MKSLGKNPLSTGVNRLHHGSGSGWDSTEPLFDDSHIVDERLVLSLIYRPFCFAANVANQGSSSTL